MNRKLIAATVAIITVLALYGCMKEDELSSPVVDGSKEIILCVNVPGMNIPCTRALDSADEKNVSGIDVLIFSNADDTLLEYHRIVSGIEATGGTSDYAFSITDIVNANDVTIAVIANASVMVAKALTSVTVNGIYEGAAKKDFLEALKVSALTKWNTTATDYWKLPMYGEVVITGSIYSSSIHTIDLMRMQAKVDVVNSASTDFTLSAVHVVNYNTAGLVAPAWNPTTGKLITGSITQPNIPLGFDPATCVWNDGDEHTYPTTTNRVEGEIYLFESNALYDPAEDLNENNPTVTPGKLRLVIEGIWNGANYYYPIDFVDTDCKYMPVLRNHSYLFTITAAEGPGYTSLGEAVANYTMPANLKVAYLVVDENDIRDIVWNGGSFLGSNGAIEISYEAGSTLSTLILTNVADGWQIDTSVGNGTGITYDTGTDWLTAVKDGLDTDPKADLKLTTLTDNNGGSVERIAYVHLKAGRLTHIVQVKQLIGPPALDPGVITGAGNIAMNTYVGAFWKADQRGERLINIQIPANNASNTYSGTWVVRVLDPGDFAEGEILFQSWTGNLPSNDFNNGDTPALTAGEKTLLGTVDNGGKITFKIGLGNKWSEQSGYAAQPVRYARVAVSFGANFAYNRVLYIRQGEEADYLLHTDDISSARRYSPYNLTAPGMNNDDHTPIPNLNGGVFVDYPSMAGGMFVWASGDASLLRASWHPTKQLTTWSHHAPYTLTPDYAPNESCPIIGTTTYRRPTRTEFPNSLFVNQSAPNSNSIFGCYADGYFDRYYDGSTTYSVNPNSYKVAYAGILFYNSIASSKRHNASLFFPNAGMRDAKRGSGTPYGAVLDHVIGWGCYQTKDCDGYSYAYHMFFFNSSTHKYEYNGIQRSSAVSLRCVVN